MMEPSLPDTPEHLPVPKSPASCGHRHPLLGGGGQTVRKHATCQWFSLLRPTWPLDSDTRPRATHVSALLAVCQHAAGGRLGGSDVGSLGAGAEVQLHGWPEPLCLRAASPLAFPRNSSLSTSFGPDWTWNDQYLTRLPDSTLAASVPGPIVRPPRGQSCQRVGSPLLRLESPEFGESNPESLV